MWCLVKCRKDENGLDMTREACRRTARGNLTPSQVRGGTLSSPSPSMGRGQGVRFLRCRGETPGHEGAVLRELCSPRVKTRGWNRFVNTQAPHKAGLFGIHPFNLVETKEPCEGRAWVLTTWSSPGFQPGDCKNRDSSLSSKRQETESFLLRCALPRPRLLRKCSCPGIHPRGKVGFIPGTIEPERTKGSAPGVAFDPARGRAFLLHGARRGAPR